jgi:hypothetical protein
VDVRVQIDEMQAQDNTGHYYGGPRETALVKEIGVDRDAAYDEVRRKEKAKRSERDFRNEESQNPDGN